MVALPGGGVTTFDGGMASSVGGMRDTGCGTPFWLNLISASERYRLLITVSGVGGDFSQT